MQVSNPNDIRIYNLSAGKSLPEWLSDRKKRRLQQKDVDIQRRIELLQDFDMPIASTSVQVTPDKQHIIAAGLYKPRIRCFDVNQLSMKFERCTDYATVKFQILENDYRKLVLLQEDRHVEFHAQYGQYYRTRIPKYGRDMDHHYPTSDLYIVGAGSKIYRLNLELGQYLAPLSTDASEIMCCQFNPAHYLFTVGTKEGTVECWDPRVRKRVGLLDVAATGFTAEHGLQGVPAVTALEHRDALNFGIGTSSGHVLLYDLRSDKPLLVKDHRYELPIKRVRFHHSQDLVLSADSSVLKLWDRHTGKPYTAIEPETNINDVCLFPDTGMLFMATEAPKMLTYYIPALGPAPKWCSFLDSLTEELEESKGSSVYDNYTFVTRTELDQLQLSHLIGSNLLRAYMHGFFMDTRLYNKAKAIADPFAYDSYRKAKIREKIEEERAARVTVKKKLPKVNKALAEKLQLAREEHQEVLDGKKRTKKEKQRAEESATLLGDDRFSVMFKDPAFQVDPESEEYRLINPVLTKADKSRKKKLQELAEEEEEEEVRPESEDEEEDGKGAEDEEEEIVPSAKRKKHDKASEGRKVPAGEREMKLVELADLDTSTASGGKKKRSRMALGERAVLENREEEEVRVISGSTGAREMTFKLNKGAEERRERQKEEHVRERKSLRRQAPPGGRKYANKFFR